jgi:hypothetical protein
MRTSHALPLALSLAALLAGCGGAGVPADVSGPPPFADVPVTASGAPTCDGARLSAPFLGKDHLLVGLSTEDEASAAAAPYDLRYHYISGGVSPGAAPCTACDGSCATWWGCWQDATKPLGLYARDFVAKAKAASPAQVPMFTYYQLLQSMASPSEGDAEVRQVADAAFMRRYLADYRLLLQQIGSDVAVVHLEPDFWGYAGRRKQACAAIPAAVASANPTDCGGEPDTLQGLGRCMIAMARRYAPNAKVGLHASSWGYAYDALVNADASFDVAAEARRVGLFLAGCGAGDGDFVAADMSDRDAGTNGKWWDPTNATLPSFHQAFTWGRAVADAVGRPLLWWQVPVGNTTMGLPKAQQDNRVDYLLTHAGEIAAGGAVGVAFGAGAAGEATPEADGGNLAARTRALAAGVSAPPCQ